MLLQLNTRIWYYSFLSMLILLGFYFPLQIGSLGWLKHSLITQEQKGVQPNILPVLLRAKRFPLENTDGNSSNHPVETYLKTNASFSSLKISPLLMTTIASDYLSSSNDSKESG